MPMYRYQLSGSPVNCATMPNLSLIPPFPLQYATDSNINEAQLQTYYSTLQGKVIQIIVNTVNGIPDAIRAEVQKILFPGSVTPIPGTPIVDVVVNPSEPSGQPDIWRTNGDWFVHPLSNPLTTSGVNNVTIAPRIADPPQAVSARVAATRIFV